MKSLNNWFIYSFEDTNQKRFLKTNYKPKINETTGPNFSSDFTFNYRFCLTFKKRFPRNVTETLIPNGMYAFNCYAKKRLINVY